MPVRYLNIRAILLTGIRDYFVTLNEISESWKEITAGGIAATQPIF